MSETNKVVIWTARYSPNGITAERSEAVIPSAKNGQTDHLASV